MTGTLAVGWVQGTTHSVEREALLGWLGDIFGEVKVRDRGLPWYEGSASIGDLGVSVGFGPRSKSNHPNECFVVVPASALDTLGWSGQVALLDLLAWAGVRFSRVDLSYDDLARVADPSEVLAAREAGNVLTHTQAWRSVRDHKGGMTTYIGSRTAEFMLRVYRKWAESGDPDAGVRWEVEAKGERAGMVASAVIHAESPVEAFWGVVRGFVDFRDRSGVERGDRAPLLGWWAILTGEVERVRLAVERPVATLFRKVLWLRRSVARSLAAIDAAGYDVGCLVEEGYWRLSRGMPGEGRSLPGAASAW